MYIYHGNNKQNQTFYTSILFFTRVSYVLSDVRAGPEALEPAKPGPQKPEPAQALARAREGSGPGLGSGPA